MAEAAQAEAGAAMSPTDIKNEPNPLDSFNFSMSPETTKRSLDNIEATIETPEAKRLKMEDHGNLNHDHQSHDANAGVVDIDNDEMSLIVQNALSNISDIIGQFSEDPAAPTGADLNHHHHHHDASGNHNGSDEANHAANAVVPTTEAGVPTNADGLDALGIPDDTTPTPVSFVDDPTRFARNANLHALGSISISMLLLLSQNPFDGIAEKMKDSSSEHKCRFSQLTRSLESVRSLFLMLAGADSSSVGPMVFADDLELNSPDASTIMQFANLAQMSAWLVDGSPEAMRLADTHLAAVFRDEIMGLPRRIVRMYVDLKTHRAVQAMSERGVSSLSQQDLEAVFLDGVEDRLREQNIANQIIGTEDTVTASLRNRIQEIQALPAEMDLPTTYPWDELIRNFAPHARNQLALAPDLGRKLGIAMPITEHSVEPMADEPEIDAMDLEDLTSFFERTANGLVENALADFGVEHLETEALGNTNNDTNTNAAATTTEAGTDATADNNNTNNTNNDATTTATPAAAGVTDDSNNNSTNNNNTSSSSSSTANAAVAKPEETPKPPIPDYKELEALVAESTSNYVKTTLQGLSPTPYQPTVPSSTAETMAAQSSFMHGLHVPQSSYYTSFAQATADQQHQQQHQQQNQQPQQQQQQPQQQHQQQQQPQQQQQQQQHPQPQHQQQHHQHQPQQQQQQQPQQPHVPGQHLPPNQTCSSALLYEKARQAALSRQTAHTRREGVHSTRRPWSQEEEKALMTGLDMVKGPHWSQILSLFGPNGSMSDILKDRTQVQLKDKARNLKLFFLKTNSEMPYYLNSVTGELKTRAPTQAARKEAEERARMNTEDDQTKLHNIMALTGNLQHAANAGQNRTANVVTPAQAAAQATAQAVQNRASALASKQPARPPISGANLQALAQQQQAQQQQQQRPQGQQQAQQQQMPPQTPRAQPQQQQQQQQASQQDAQQALHQQQHQTHVNDAPSASQPYGDQSSVTPRRATPVQNMATTPHQQHYSATPTPMATTPVQQHQQLQQQQHHSPTPGPPSTATSVHQHSAYHSPAQGSHMAMSSPATPTFPQQQHQVHHQHQQSHDTDMSGIELDNETEALLIRDLQAAVAQATTT